MGNSTTATALVCGSASAQGEALCRALGTAGVRVVAVGGCAPADEVVAADLATREGQARALETLRQRGPFDLLVNLPPVAADLSGALRHSESSLALCRAAAAFMAQLDGGRILNLVHAAALLAPAADAVGAATAAALVAFSRGLGEEFAADGIAVHAVALAGEDMDWLAPVLEGTADTLLVPDAHTRARLAALLAQRAAALQ
ncbi:SDR family NAD(P)-dependent oxidoreductase [Mangrovimicrobium sediminis]|uniref:SDR family NAD(P)-dependent oxidoreductase n=1 Tax=Mangrovimicrobium sediminis TaxID=2562682 RepID=A0A4Z0LXM1_9GAMM|nr:SDR family NAD(P)-dependent oxidoreductase [Haliea sp. SAOS-164]TGD72082.1 SDR family NAD(P)-dependent oxidoreductase [Haliea sp. SAOS-164]